MDTQRCPKQQALMEAPRTQILQMGQDTEGKARLALRHQQSQRGFKAVPL